MQIQGKTAVVTGGTDGIGLWIARHLQRGGARIIVCGRRPDLLDAARCEGFEAITADLSSPEGVAAFADQIAVRDIDILINNAGAGSEYVLANPVDLGATDQTIFLNVNAPIHLITRLIDQLKARPEAAIVNVTSGLAIAPRAGSPVYCATKAALRSFTKAIRFQLKSSNIHVIEALPPVVETAMTAARAGKKMSAEACAREIVDAIIDNRTEANVGMVKILKAVHSVSPRLAEAIMIRF